jgi:hypothetical protein
LAALDERVDADALPSPTVRDAPTAIAAMVKSRLFIDPLSCRRDTGRAR